MSYRHKLTWREFIIHARNPIGYGGYEKVFLFFDVSSSPFGKDPFFMCYECLSANNEEGIREYAKQVYAGELEVFLVDSADIEVDEAFCDVCNLDMSPYQEDNEVVKCCNEYEDDFNPRDFLPAWAFRMEV